MTQTRRGNEQQRLDDPTEFPVLVRRATAADRMALARLAELEGAERLRGEVVVAEVGGALWAARSLSDDRALSDPFRPTVKLLELLELRARQLTGADRVSRRTLWSLDRLALRLLRGAV